MSLSPALLSSLLLAQSLPTVFDANADYADGRLSIEVVTSEPVPEHDVRSKLTGDSLVLYVQGAVVERNRRVFARPDGRAVNAFPRAEYTKFAVPFGPEQTCAGEIAIEVKENRVRASVGCSDRVDKAVAQSVREPGHPWRSPPARPPTEAEVAKPEPIAARAQFAGAPSPAASAPPPVEPSPPAAPAAAPVPAPPAPPAPSPAPPAPILAAVPAPLPALAPTVRTPPVSEPGSRSGGFGGTAPVLVAMLLAAASIFLIWRRRRQHGLGLIRILESASLGPKRSLVVAQIGGQKLILGASEAGITLLSPIGSSLSQADGEDPTLVNETGPGPAEGEKGLLARLFSRRREEQFLPEEEGPSTMAEDFRDLLEENIEDEELRRRLQAGAGGRTR